MSCLTAEQVDQFARNSLDTATAAALQAHLQGCEPCRRRVEQAREDERLLGKLKDLPDSAATQPQDGSPALDPMAPAGTPREPRTPVFSSPPPDSFAGYQIIREIHRGGQGVVYQAVQKSTKRKVAIKVMKEGPFASRGDKARFEREVEILGQLNHPNIVSVHDSGQAAGSFYFVMDYISGQPLDVWLASREHSVEETLRLFQKICEAVHAAHLKGIIHRDLKPGNIRIDDAGEPYVLDFGLAKVAHGAEEASLMTMTGQFMGSLPWASPEQAEAKPGMVDMRTDVYSLGVVLYQMLTGKFPYDVMGNMRDVLDRIMRAEPVRPTVIRKQLDDEVDTIVLKCLAKERERRYQSAGELGRDIGHYLKNEPVEAKRDSTLYLLKKSIQRHRAAVVVAVGFAGLLSVAAIVTLGQYAQVSHLYGLAEQAKRDLAESVMRAEQRAREAEQQKREADRHRALAEQNAAEAKHQRIKASAVLTFFESILESADPYTSTGAAFTLREALDRAAQRADSELVNQQEVLAAIHGTIGRAYSGLGLHDQAKRHLSKSVDIWRELVLAAIPENRDRLELELAGGLQDLSYQSIFDPIIDPVNDRRDAVAQCREALAIRRRLLGQNHPDTIETAIIETSILRPRGEQLTTDDPRFRACTAFIVTQVRDEDCPEPFLAVVQEARRRGLAGEFDSAVSLIVEYYFRRMEEIERLAAAGQMEGARLIARQHATALMRNTLWQSRTVEVMMAWADQFAELGRRHAAEAVLREAIEISAIVLGQESGQLVKVYTKLADLLQWRGAYAESEESYRHALALAERVLGDEHRDTAMVRCGLACTLSAGGQYAEAEELVRRAIKAHLELMSDEVVIADTFQLLGEILFHQENWGEAEEAFIEALRRKRISLAETSASTLLTKAWLADLLVRAGKLPAVRSWLSAILACRSEGFLDEQRASLAARLAELANQLLSHGHGEDAETLAAKCLEILGPVTGDPSRSCNPQLAETHRQIGSLYIQVGRYEQAEKELREAYQATAREAQEGCGNFAAKRQAALAILGFVRLYEAWNQPNQATAWRVKVTEWQASTQSADRDHYSATTSQPASAPSEETSGSPPSDPTATEPAVEPSTQPTEPTNE